MHIGIANQTPGTNERVRSDFNLLDRNHPRARNANPLREAQGCIFADVEGCAPGDDMGIGPTAGVDIDAVLNNQAATCADLNVGEAVAANHTPDFGPPQAQVSACDAPVEIEEVEFHRVNPEKPRS